MGLMIGLLADGAKKIGLADDTRGSPVTTVPENSHRRGVLGETTFLAGPKFSMRSEMREEFAKIRFNLLATENKPREWKETHMTDDLGLPSILNKYLRGVVTETDLEEVQKVNKRIFRPIHHEAKGCALRERIPNNANADQQRQTTAFAVNAASIMRTFAKKSASSKTQRKNQASKDLSPSFVIAVFQFLHLRGRSRIFSTCFRLSFHTIGGRIS